ncbi:DUF3369 domain-containing protein [Catenovulum sp. SM1970]|nr:DUF3369 domain-containing protein [Marinifaba aquimaris]
MLDDDFSDFYDEEPKTLSPQKAPWHVLVVDDDEDIHHSTQIALKTFEFEERKIQITSAFSAQQALEILTENNHFALVFIDVVMESDDAGLELVKTIRDVLNNKTSRLILRTGQPGFAPEDEVIRNYDINDYRNKTELTASKLKNSCYTALRSYRDLCDLERNKNGLAQVIAATNKFQEASSHHEFSSNLFAHVRGVAQVDDSDIYCCIVHNTGLGNDTQFKILAVTNTDKLQELDYQQLPENVKDAYQQAMDSQQSIRNDESFVGYFKTKSGTQNLMYVSSPKPLSIVEHNLLEHFSNSVAVSYENMSLRLTVQESQKEISYILGEAVEKRSQETGSHVRRVAHYCYILSQKLGLPALFSNHLKAAAPLHDIGKIAIPDLILNKPGKLTPEEWEVMKTHATHGAEILNKSNNQVLKVGAIVAGQHHEKWDGTGYPNGLKGEEIHIAGRITALADVFDALSHERCYKQAWPEQKVLAFITEQKGKHFDPHLVELLFENIELFREVKARFPD